MTTSKFKNNYRERDNTKTSTHRVIKMIRPMNLREKLIINAKNKIN